MEVFGWPRNGDGAVDVMNQFPATGQDPGDITMFGFRVTGPAAVMDTDGFPDIGNKFHKTMIL